MKQNNQFRHPVVEHKNEPRILSVCIEDRQTIKRRNKQNFLDRVSKTSKTFCHSVVEHKNEPRVLSLCIEDRQTIKRRNKQNFLDGVSKTLKTFCRSVVEHKNEPHILSLCIEDRQTIKRMNATFWMVLRNVLLVAGVWIHFRKLGHAEQLNIQNFSFLHKPPTKPSSPVCSAHAVLPLS